MPRYVALLRGINLGGKTMIKMDELKAEFGRLGFENITSYINSGNLAFDARKVAEASLVDKLEQAIETRFGRAVDVMVREQKDIERIIAANPFEGQYESHKQMHVLFLKEPMPAEKVQQLYAATFPGERFEISGLELYYLLPGGVADSLLSKGFFEKKPRVSFTARNWRTVEKLSVL